MNYLVKLFLIAAFSLGGLFFCYSISLAYDDLYTHPALTKEVADFYNAAYSEIDLKNEEIDWLMAGSREEDIVPRWINHFYDPITGQGWNAERMSDIPENAVRSLAKIAISSENAVSSLNWAHNQELQRMYASFGGNQTFEMALNHYLAGDKEKAYRALGQVLHLLEDMAVPAHTRQDSHASVPIERFDDPEPYEIWAKDYAQKYKLGITEKMMKNGEKPKSCGSLDECMIYLAKYSNNNFFSEDTINDGFYKYPSSGLLEKRLTEGGFNYFDKNLNIPIVFCSLDYWENSQCLLNEELHIAYFSLLSKQAVLTGAGMVKYFHEQAEKARKGEVKIEAEPKFSTILPVKAGILITYEESKNCRLPVFSLYSSFLSIQDFFSAVSDFVFDFSQKIVHESGDLPIKAGMLVTYEETKEYNALLEQEEKKPETPSSKPELAPAPIFNIEEITSSIVEVARQEENKEENGAGSNEQEQETDDKISDKKGEGGDRLALISRPYAGSAGTPYSGNENIFLENFENQTEDFNGGENNNKEEDDNLLVSPPSPIITSHNIGDRLNAGHDKDIEAEGVQITVAGTAEMASRLAFSVNSTTVDFLDLTGEDWLLEIDLSEGINVLSVFSEAENGLLSPTTTLELMLDTQAPADISELLAVPGSSIGSVELSWPAVLNDISGIKSYEIFYATSTFGNENEQVSGDNKFWEKIVVLENLAGEENLSFAVDNLKKDLIFYFMIRSVDNSGNVSGFSNVAESMPNAAANHLLINEIQLAEKEFVELYNPTTALIDLSNFYFAYFPAGEDWNNPSGIRKFPAEAKIKAKGYYLVGLTGYSENGEGIRADWQVYSSATLDNEAGAIAIFSDWPSEDDILPEEARALAVDVFGWGETQNVFEGLPWDGVALPYSEKSIGRSQLGVDRDNNMIDFSVKETPDPRNFLSVDGGESLLSDLAWPIFQQNSRRTGKSFYAGPLGDIKAKWLEPADLGGCFSAQPIIGKDGFIFALSDSGVLYKVNPENGNHEILFESGVFNNEPLFAPIATADGTLYFSVSSIFYAVDGDSGKLRWYRQLEGRPFLPLLEGGDIYVADKMFLYRFSPNGALIYKKSSSNLWGGGLAADGDYLYLNEINKIGQTILTKVDRRTGEILARSLDALFYNYAPVLSDQGDELFANVSGGYHGSYLIFALNKETLALNDYFSFYRNPMGALPSLDEENSKLYWAFIDGSVGALEIKRGADEKLLTGMPWIKKIASSFSSSAVLALDSKGMIFTSSKEGVLYALEPEKGDIIWSFDTGASLSSSLVIGANKSIYIISEDGKMWGLTEARE